MSSNIDPKAKIYAILADSVYWDVRYGGKFGEELKNSNWTPVPSDWQLIKQESHSGKGALNPNGFTARAYKNGNEIVIAYAGTEFTNIVGDWINNNLALGTVDQSEQANQAAIFYHQVKHENPNATIKFTGHSLGGGLAGLMGVLFDKEAYLFDHAPFKAAALLDSPLVAEYTKEDLQYDPSKTNLSFDEVKQKIIDLIKDKVTVTPDDFLYAGLGFLGSQVIDRLVFGTTRDGIMKALKAQVLKNQKNQDGFTQIDEAFLNYRSADYNDRASKLTAIAVKGEFLDLVTPASQSPIGNIAGHFIKNDYVIDGENSASAGAKHAQTLLVSALLDDNFEHYTSVDNNGANIDTLSMILDDTLYAYDPGSSQQNFLTKLVRSHIGATTGGIDYATGDVNTDGTPVKASHSLLTTFGNSLKIIAESLKPYTDNYAKLGHDALIAHAIEWHYHQDVDNYDGSYFIVNNSNTLQFTTAVGDNLLDKDSKATSYAQKWIDEAYVQLNINKNNHDFNIEDYHQWNVALDGADATAIDDQKAQLLMTLGQQGAKFTGGDKDDLLFGYHGNDTLKGGAGNDQLLGAEGFDTYHIKDSDTIFDSDAKGVVMFDGKALPSSFIKREGVSDIWEAKDAKGNVLYTAAKEAQDFVISSVNSATDKVTIKDFFTTAHTVGTTYSALSVTLGDSQEDIDKHGTYVIKADDKLPAVIYTGGYPSNFLDITATDKHDYIMATGNKQSNINAGGGNDLIFGGNLADVIKGGKDHDIISGSPAFYDFASPDSHELPTEDNDTLIGNEGNDLIAGGVGRDTIWVDDVYQGDYKHPANPNNVHNNDKGDWALGGRGNDTIYGGANKDFLQGGADSDTIHGGGGDDVILGDAQIRFGNKALHIQGGSGDISWNYGNVGGGIYKY